MIENIPENPTKQINSTPMVTAEKKVQPLTLIIVVIAVLLIGAGGFLLKKVFHKPKACTLEAKICPDGSAVGRTGPNCEFALCPTQAPSFTQTPDETTNWKTYTNTINKYALKIPQNWVVNDQKGVFVQIPGEVTFTSPSEASIPEEVFRTKVAIVAMTTEKIRYSLNTQQQFSDWLGKDVSTGEGERLFKIGNVKVGGIDAVKFVSRSYPGDATDAFYSMVTWLRKNGTNYYLELGGDENKVLQFTPIYNQILSTFKFTDQNKEVIIEPSVTTFKKINILSTAGWKTVYQNGVSFKIPQEANCKQSPLDTNNNEKDCRNIFFSSNQIIPQKISVTKYLGGSRREQYLGKDATDCRWIFEDALFGNVKALQIALDPAWCQGGGGAIVAVIGDKLVTFPNLGYNPETKVIDRFPIRDTVVSTLKVGQ